MGALEQRAQNGESVQVELDAFAENATEPLITAPMPKTTMPDMGSLVKPSWLPVHCREITMDTIREELLAAQYVRALERTWTVDLHEHPETGEEWIHISGRGIPGGRDIPLTSYAAADKALGGWQVWAPLVRGPKTPSEVAAAYPPPWQAQAEKKTLLRALRMIRDERRRKGYVYERQPASCPRLNSVRVLPEAVGDLQVELRRNVRRAKADQEYGFWVLRLCDPWGSWTTVPIDTIHRPETFRCRMEEHLGMSLVDWVVGCGLRRYLASWYAPEITNDNKDDVALIYAASACWTACWAWPETIAGRAA